MWFLWRVIEEMDLVVVLEEVSGRSGVLFELVMDRFLELCCVVRRVRFCMVL